MLLSREALAKVLVSFGLNVTYNYKLLLKSQYKLNTFEIYSPYKGLLIIWY